MIVIAKFKFKLQRYLDLKLQIEEQKKINYGIAVSELEKAKQEKEDLIIKKNLKTYEFRSTIKKNIDIEKFKIYNDYLGFIKKKIIKQDKVIVQYEKIVEEKRLELIQAVKESKMIDKLKEKELEKFIKEERILEEKIVDEIVSYKYSKKLGKGV